ncbi:hypothetical protein ACPPVO_23500 [Dactylosporangium sp. McL0621]|uniref:hypothetical protein n=1 Tax=Dactylosporangium sp. McL0621 TaxID=3415678 RepID=UPI003CEBDCB5
MINLSDRIPAHYSQRARTELSAAWEHLLTAAQDTARQVADTSRARGSVARERAVLARLALRGELPTSRWRWAAGGLAAGLVIGVVAATAVNRRLHPAGPDAAQQPNEPPSAVLDKARAAAAAVGERASTAVHTAAAAARDAADKARNTVTRREPEAEFPPSTVPATDRDD